MSGRGEQERLLPWTVTQGSQIILPCYPVMFFALGLLMIFQGASRTSTPAYGAAKDFMRLFGFDHPIVAWGVVFVVVALVEVAAMALQLRNTFRWGLIVGTFIAGFWTATLVASALNSDMASFTSGVWTGFATLAHVASARSVARDKVWFSDDEAWIKGLIRRLGRRHD